MVEKAAIETTRYAARSATQKKVEDFQQAKCLKNAAKVK